MKFESADEALRFQRLRDLLGHMITAGMAQAGWVQNVKDAITLGLRPWANQLPGYYEGNPEKIPEKL